MKKKLSPTQILALSFLLVILTGTFLLSLPQASKETSLSFVDALFTATSATCVTGLIVVDTGSHFTLFGQIVILFLIQLGGLGIMTASIFFAFILGRHISIKERMLIKESLGAEGIGKILHRLSQVLIFTVTIEILGASLLFFLFKEDFSSGRAAYLAIFHSVSAFCNAGFSLFKESLIGYQGSILANLTFSFLIILGGIGFVVVADIGGALRKAKRLSLHTKSVLTVTVILIVSSAFLFYFLEGKGVLLGLSAKAKICSSYFLSITPRTAGFNSLPTEALSSASLFLIIFLMFVGGAPGSTAGGIKVSTLAVLFGVVSSLIKGRDEIELYKRTIPKEIGQKALAIITLSVLTVLVSTFLLLLLKEAGSFLEILFEVTSAFGTVGLSTGLTHRLSFLGKMVIIALMFVGRLGPLTVALAVGEKKTKAPYKFPEERVVIG
ncbi:TrkH family potassium uptake protein [bacterium]|nr:TrkH family potassium uptake protein [bacterium]